MRKVLITLPVMAIALGGATACATKGFVQNRVGEVNSKVESLSSSVEENQERTRQNEARIAEVNQRTEAAAQSAAQAGQSAKQAQSSADAAASRVEAVDRATKRLIYEVVLTEDKARFEFGKTQLADEVKAELDRVVQQLKADPKGYYIEIEGHTDNIGTKLVNERIGLKRAEEVKRYLYENHQVPLHKINVISYGEDKPIAPNDNRDNRAQNRRVVIKVLA
jgi:outer membrane protein OmpA-like peptidoglycan-associated protein